MISTKIGAVRFQGDFAHVDLMLPRHVGEWLEREATKQKVSARQLVKKLLMQLSAAQEQTQKKKAKR